MEDWPTREDSFLGKHRVKSATLVNSEQVPLRALRMKLGPLKNFVNALDKSG